MYRVMMYETDVFLMILRSVDLMSRDFAGRSVLVGKHRLAELDVPLVAWLIREMFAMINQIGDARVVEHGDV